jgi:hypothetical protein
MTAYEDPGCLCKCCCAPCAVYMAKECAVSTVLLMSESAQHAVGTVGRADAVKHPGRCTVNLIALRGNIYNNYSPE